MHIPTSAEIREKRKALKLTQNEIAQKAGLSQSMVARIEAGSVDPRVSTLRKITSVLEKSESSQITAKDLMHAPVLSVRPDETLRETVRLMERHGISQLPVVGRGSPVGCISESAIINAVEQGKIQRTEGHLVNEFMEDCFPTVPPSLDMDTIVHTLHHHHALLVIEKGKVVGVITKHDLIAFIS